MSYFYARGFVHLLERQASSTRTFEAGTQTRCCFCRLMAIQITHYQYGQA